MSLQSRGVSFAAPGVSVRRYLSEADEKKAVRVLKEQLRRQERITSDDVRHAVRTVANQDGALLLPPDFPPSCWVFEFKRAHGFVHFTNLSFSTGASSTSGGKPAAAFGLPERLDVPPLRSAVPAVHGQRAINAPTVNTSSTSNNINSNGKGNSNSRAGTAQATSPSSGNDCDDEHETNQDRRDLSPLDPVHVVMYSTSTSGPRTPFDSETQRQVQLRHSFSQHHRQHLQQQQRRANVVDDRRRSAAWSIPMRNSSANHGEIRSNASSSSVNGTTTGPSNSPGGSNGDIIPALSGGISLMLPRIRHDVSYNGSSVQEMQDTASNASSNDKRGYKLSHTVPAETWSKAIAAVEQHGMSLRATAKRYGVHFAALHRRVKKRALAVHAKGTNGYFHPSDEAGIMRVVVARAELGVLMTFDELMRLVEAAALRKLPDISMDSARKLLTRFQTRNEQSIRHIIDDWPPPRPAVNVSSTSTEGLRPQHEPYLGHPGFNFGQKPPVILRPPLVGAPSRAASVVAMAAAAKTALFVPPSRLGPPPSSVERRASRSRMGVANDRLLFASPQARSEGDSDVLMVV